MNDKPITYVAAIIFLTEEQKKNKPDFLKQILEEHGYEDESHERRVRAIFYEEDISDLDSGEYTINITDFIRSEEKPYKCLDIILCSFDEDLFNRIWTNQLISDPHFANVIDCIEMIDYSECDCRQLLHEVTDVVYRTFFNGDQFLIVDGKPIFYEELRKEYENGK